MWTSVSISPTACTCSRKGISATRAPRALSARTSPSAPNTSRSDFLIGWGHGDLHPHLPLLPRPAHHRPDARGGGGPRAAAAGEVGPRSGRGHFLARGRGGQARRALPRPDESRAEQVKGARRQASAGAQEGQGRSDQAAEPDGHGLSALVAPPVFGSEGRLTISPTVNMPEAC